MLRLLRAFVAVWLVGGLLAPTHFVAAVSHAFVEDSVEVTQCPDDDDQCPPNCSSCPCGEVPCVPAPAQAALTRVLEEALLANRLDPAPLRDLQARHRVERPPRA